MSTIALITPTIVIQEFMAIRNEFEVRIFLKKHSYFHTPTMSNINVVQYFFKKIHFCAFAIYFFHKCLVKILLQWKKDCSFKNNFRTLYDMTQSHRKVCKSGLGERVVAQGLLKEEVLCFYSCKNRGRGASGPPLSP